MGILSDFTKKIRNAIYVKDVRDAIADGLEHVESLEEKNLETYNNMVIGAGESNAEIVDARLDNNTGVRYEKVGKRLDKISSQIDENANLLNARMDTFTTLTEGSTTGDAELIDGRVGADGTIYENIGNAIRKQVSDIKGNIDKTEEIFFSKSINKFNCNDVTNKLQYSSQTGTFNTASEKWKISNIIQVAEGDILRATFPNSATYGFYFVFLSENNINNSSIISASKISDWATEAEISIPEGVKFIVLSFNIMNDNEWSENMIITINNEIPSIFIHYGQIELKDVYGTEEIKNNVADLQEQVSDIKGNIEPIKRKRIFYGSGEGQKVINAEIGNEISFTSNIYRRLYKAEIDEKKEYYLSNCMSTTSTQAWAIVDENNIVLACGGFEELKTGVKIPKISGGKILYWSVEDRRTSILYEDYGDYIIYKGDKLTYSITDLSLTESVKVSETNNVIDGYNSYLFICNGNSQSISISVNYENQSTVGFWIKMPYNDISKISNIDISFNSGGTVVRSSTIKPDNLKLMEWFFHKVIVDLKIDNITITPNLNSENEVINFELSPFIVFNQFTRPTYIINFDQAWQASSDCGLYDKLIENNIPFTITGTLENVDENTKEKLLDAYKKGILDIGMYGNEEYDGINYPVSDGSKTYKEAQEAMNFILDKKFSYGVSPISFGPRGHEITPLIKRCVKNNGFKVIRNYGSQYSNNCIFDYKEDLIGIVETHIQPVISELISSSTGGSCFAMFAHGVSSNPNEESSPSLYNKWSEVEKIIDAIISMRDSNKAIILNMKQFYEYITFVKY